MSDQPRTVLVTGAGVDKTPGIDFPIAADLLPAINGYLNRTEEGKAIHALLNENIVVVGYSLNTADEHFNDLLRAQRGKRITAIGPEVLSDDYLQRVSSAWSINPDQFTGTRIHGKEAKRSGGVVLIEAKANEVDLNGITQNNT